MSHTNVEFCCQVSMEAEDVSQSRILSTTSYVKNRLQQAAAECIRQLQTEDTSDLEEFAVRIYLGDTVTCEMEAEDAEMIAPEFAEVLMDIAEFHSYLELEGTLSVTCAGETESYRIYSVGGDGYCSLERQ